MHLRQSWRNMEESYKAKHYSHSSEESGLRSAIKTTGPERVSPCLHGGMTRLNEEIKV